MTSPFAPLEATLVDVDFTAVEDAILAAYPDKEVLYDLLLREWGVRVSDIIFVGQAGKLVVAALVAWARAQGRTLDLLVVTWEDREREYRLLEELARRWIQAPPKKLERTARDALTRLQSLDSFALEAVVLKPDSALPDLKIFTDLAGAVCIVDVEELPTATGFLIGRRTVLTTHSAVGAAMKAGVSGDHIRVRFDGVDPHGEHAFAGAQRTDWIGPSSAAADTDVSGTEPGAEAERQLDFALIRLATAVPKARPVLKLPTRVPIAPPGDTMVVLHHPMGRTLEISAGRLSEYSRDGVRVTYEAVTAPGSAGAPVFTAEGDLIALHHAVQLRHGIFKLSQGVPIWRIRQAIVDAGLDPAEL